MRFLPRTLSARLALVAIATVVPIAILTVVSYFERQENEHDREVAAAEAYGLALAANIDSLGRSIENVVLAAALALGQESPALGAPSTPRYLAELAAANPVLQAVFATNLEGRVVAQSSGTDTGFSVADRPYLRALAGGAETAWSGGLEELRTGAVTVAHGRTIRSPDGVAIGYLIAAFHPGALADSLGHAPDDSHLLLLDQQAQVIFSDRPDEVRLGVPAPPWTPGDAAAGGTTVSLDGETTPFDTDTRYGVVVPIPGVGWTLVYTRSESVLEEALRNQLLRDLSILVVVGAVSLALLMLVSRQITRPISELAWTATTLASGRPAELPAGAQDPDIAELERAFSAMVLADREREREIREQAAILERLNRAGEELATDLDLDRAIQSVTSASIAATRAEAGTFLTHEASVDGQESEARRPGSALVRRALDGEIVRVGFLPEGESPGQITVAFGLAVEKEVQSVLAVPVRSKSGRLLGTMVLAHSGRDAFSEQDEEVALGIAVWSGIAVENARLYGETKFEAGQLQEANRTKDEFLGLISHELRTPTTVIDGSIRLLAERGDKLQAEDRKELLDGMVEESGRLVSLIEDLLAFARTELVGVEPEVVRIDREAEGIVRRFRSQTRRPGIEVVANADLPMAAVEVTYFRQVLTNLLSNAHKYSPRDSPIIVEIAAAGEEIVVSVLDRGPGVPEEDIERIFETFYRSAGTAGTARGHGLGLTVCRRLIDAMGGRIWAANIAGGGLGVSFSVPLAREPVGELE